VSGVGSWDYWGKRVVAMIWYDTITSPSAGYYHPYVINIAVIF